MPEEVRPVDVTTGPNTENETCPTPILADNRKLSARFMALFAGSSRCHGSYLLTDERDWPKRKGRAVTLTGPVTEADWEAHLSGRGAGVGVCPLLEDDATFWGAVDIDVYGLDHGEIAALLFDRHIPEVCARSESGGIHVLVFAKEAVRAQQMVDRLRKIAAELGHPDTECFPKQIENTQKGGNWLNMPYYGGDETNRYAVRPNGDAMTVSEFLQRAEALKAKTGPIGSALR